MNINVFALASQLYQCHYLKNWIIPSFLSWIILYILFIYSAKIFFKFYIFVNFILTFILEPPSAVNTGFHKRRYIAKQNLCHPDSFQLPDWILERKFHWWYETASLVCKGMLMETVKKPQLLSSPSLFSYSPPSCSRMSS